MQNQIRRAEHACALGCLIAAMSGVGAARAHGEPLLARDSQPTEVIVTARRRVETAQSVPLSVSVLSGRSIEATGAVRVPEIFQAIPNASSSFQNPRLMSLAIRGIGQTTANDGLEGSVGIFLDGVYFSRPGPLFTDLVDIERFEVLRGPQGTLFGKNTTAGVLNITTRAPTDEFESWIQASVGSAHDRRVSAVASGPLLPAKLSFRLSGFTDTRDGFVKDLTTGNDLGELDRGGVRAQLLWRPSANLRVRAIADYASLHEDGPGYVLVAPNATLEDGSIRANNFLDRTARAGYVPRFDPFARLTDADASLRSVSAQRGLSVQADWHIAGQELTSISAARRWDFDPHNDGDLTALDVQPNVGFDVQQRQFTQEVRLASPSDRRYELISGAFVLFQDLSSEFHSQYGHDAASFVRPGLPAEALDGFKVQVNSDPRTRSYSAFSQLNARVRSRTNLTVGVRWTSETRTAHLVRTSAGGVVAAGDPGGAQSVRASLGSPVDLHVATSEAFLSGLLSISHRLNDQTLTYASFTRGAKSGGINIAIVAPGVEQVLEPEIVRSYELGFKRQSELWHVNVSAFHSNVTHFQTSVRDPIRGASFLANAASVRSRGLELEGAYSGIAHLDLMLAAGFVDARYRSYPNAPCPPETPSASCNFTGMRVPGVPRFNAQLATTYRMQLSARAQAYLAGEYSRGSGYRAEPSRSTWIDASGIVNARFGVRAANDRWDVWMWARNAFDEDYFTSLSTGGAFGSGVVTGIPADPRSYGLSIRLAR